MRGPCRWQRKLSLVLPNRRVALVIGLLSTAVSLGSFVAVWLVDLDDDPLGVGKLALLAIAVLTGIWGLAHLIPLAFGAAFPRRPK